MSHGQNNEGVSKNSHHDGGHAIQKVSRVTDDKPGNIAAEFGEVHTTQETDRNSDETRKQQELRASNNGVGKPAAGFTHGRGQLREKIQTQRPPAFPKQVAQNKEQHG